MATITKGQRVTLFDMSGVCVGFQVVNRTGKNYCDGASTIHLSSFSLPLILWDGVDFPVTCDDISALDFI